MTDDVKQMAGARLVNMVTEANLKGAILITFESGTRETLRHSSEPIYDNAIGRVAEAIHNDMLNGDIVIPQELD
jgi:hypothetical protein